MARQAHSPAPGTASAPRPALLTRRAPAGPGAAVLFLHGGRTDSRHRSRPWHLAALRMRPFIRTVAGGTAQDDVVIGSIRYRVRGWNGRDEDPLRDTRRALAELSQRFPGIPTILVGHSMGGRAALRAADSPQVPSGRPANASPHTGTQHGPGTMNAGIDTVTDGSQARTSPPSTPPERQPVRSGTVKGPDSTEPDPCRPAWVPCRRRGVMSSGQTLKRNSNTRL
ncbi:alpha/beta hydrolase [Streptomyces xiamenensis]